MSRRTAWLLPAPAAAVPVPVAPALRLARLRAWLSELGWEPEQVGPERAPAVRSPGCCSVRSWRYVHGGRDRR
jgi:hypothetical protein